MTFLVQIEVSCLERCPSFRDILIEGFHLIHFELFAVHYVSFTLQHPDDVVMHETVEMLMKRFHGQMKAAPKLSLYDSDKGVGLQVPRETFSKMNITFTEDDV